MMRALLWVPWLALVLCVAQPLQAQQANAGLDVALLRGTSGEAGKLSQSVDAALLRDLAQIAGIEDPTVSPVDYAEIQLTAGCSEEGRSCLASIAKLVEVDTIVVRKLAVDATQASLSLLYFDASAADDPSHASRSVPAAEAASLVDQVPALVRELFGLPEPVEAAPQPEAEPVAVPSIADDTIDAQFEVGEGPVDDAGVSALTWVSLGTGAALLGAGLIVGLDAQSAYDEWKEREVGTDSEASQAESDFDSIETQGTVSTALLITGGVVLALGGTLLALDLSQDEGLDDAAALSLALSPDGASIGLRATLEGM